MIGLGNPINFLISGKDPVLSSFYILIINNKTQNKTITEYKTIPIQHHNINSYYTHYMHMIQPISYQNNKIIMIDLEETHT